MSIDTQLPGKCTLAVTAGDNELFDGVQEVIHHFVVAILQVLAVGDGRQEVVEDGHEEVHDHDYHREEVADEKQTGCHSAELHHRVQTELTQHCLHLQTAATPDYSVTDRQTD